MLDLNPTVHPTSNPEGRGDQWLPLLAPRLDSTLVSTPALGRMERLLQRLPGNAMGAIEIRLAEGSDQVDLSFRLSSSTQVRSFARRLGPRYLRDFMASWIEARDPRNPFLWLEFDLDREPAEELHPFLLSKLAGKVEARWLVDSLVPKMQAGPVSDAQKELVARSLGALPPQASPTYVSTLKARGQKTLRLDYFGLLPEQMERHLVNLRRPDLARAVREPSRLLSSAELFHLSHDLGSEVLPRLGLEGSFADSGALPRGSKWRALLERLVDAGLCTAEKRDAVLAWVGYDSSSSVPGLWPEAFRGMGGFMIRSLSHVKIVCHPEKPPEAKVYLLFGHYLRNAKGKLYLRDT